MTMFKRLRITGLVSMAALAVGIAGAVGGCGRAVGLADDGGAFDSGVPDSGVPDGCGNGTVEAGEECDDGNSVSHDGCSAVCGMEAPRWTELQPGTSPPAVANRALAHDPALGTVFFGGAHRDPNGAVIYHDETWAFDGVSWSGVAGSVPPARASHGMVFDAARGELVLFGGMNSDVSPYTFSDTWVLDGSGWLRVMGVPQPPARSWFGMAFDAARDVVVLFGGYSPDRAVGGDTWEWDGTAWLDTTPATSPPTRLGLSLAYDAARGRMVLFGGRDPGEGLLGDTWEYDGTSWVETTPGASPEARHSHALVYDAARARVVLFGGCAENGSLGCARWLADTWEYDGASWVETSPATSPPARRSHGLAWTGSRSLLQGGEGDGSNYLNDTWTYRWE